MKKIYIIGSPCNGKSTLAAKLSKALSIPHIELDSLYFRDRWRPVEHEVFNSPVLKCLAGESWIIDGNYSKVRNLVLPNADTWCKKHVSRNA